MPDNIPCPTCGLAGYIDRSQRHYGCPGPITPLQKQMIEAVRQYALEHYEDKYGFSEVIECWEDKDLLEDLIADAVTVEEALANLRSYVGIKEERYREAVGPDMVCEACGRTWQYEVGHMCESSEE